MDNRRKISAKGDNSTPNLEPITLNICNKVFQDLYDTLLQKGVTGISPDNPTGLVDGVKALPTNTIGGFKPDFPIAFFPKNEIDMGSNNFIWDITEGRYLRTQRDVGVIKIYDLSLISFDNQNNSTDYSSAALILTIDKTSVQTAIGQTLGSNFKMKIVSQSNTITYYTNTGHVGIITPDFTAKTITATYVELAAKAAALNKNTASTAYAPFATNGAKMLLSLDAGAMPYIAMVDLQTGDFDVQNWSFGFALSGGGYFNFDTKMYGSTLIGYHNTTVSIANIDWDNIDNSTATNRPHGATSRIGFDEAEEKVYQLYYVNNTLYLSIYDTNAKVETIKNIIAPLADIFFGYKKLSSTWNNSLQELCVDALPNGNKLILSPFGALVLKQDGTFEKPISGTPSYAISLRNETTVGNFNAENSICFKFNDKFYSLTFGIGLKIGLITLYYNKIITNFYLRNEAPLYYPTNKILTKGLMDGPEFDADTISLSVEVA